MELNTQSVLLQDNLIGPAFLVASGVIVAANASAQAMVTVGTPIDNLIATGADEYRKYRSGKLYLQLKIGGSAMGAYVTKLGDQHLFCMDSAYQMPELRVLALAAQQLRAPLSSAMLNADLLQNTAAFQQDTQAKTQLGQLSRGLYQLLRAIGNMADASGSYIREDRQEQRNAAGVFDELMEKATAALEGTNRELSFKGLKKIVMCPLDAELLERAVLNLISNAVKFSPEGSAIAASLRHERNRLIFTIENATTGDSSSQTLNAFQRFLREPGIDMHQYGIGLGMSIVLSAAANHGGTVLFNLSQKRNAKIVMTIATDRSAPAILESPLRFVGGYTGGLDNLLVELADVLPDSAYE